MKENEFGFFSGKKKKGPEIENQEKTLYYLENEVVGRTDVVRVIDEEVFMSAFPLEEFLVAERKRFPEEKARVRYIEKVVSTANGIFRNLASEYGISVDARYVIGRESGRLLVFGLSDRVCCGDIQTDTGGKEVAKTILGLTRYYQDVLSSFDEETGKTKPFLWDISRKDQYVFGSTQNDSSSKFRLVDIDPHWITNDIENSEGWDGNRALRFFYFNLVKMYHEINTMNEYDPLMRKSLLSLCDNWSVVSERVGSSLGISSAKEARRCVEQFFRG